MFHSWEQCDEIEREGRVPGALSFQNFQSKRCGSFQWLQIMEGGDVSEGRQERNIRKNSSPFLNFFQFLILEISLLEMCRKLKEKPF